MTSPARAGVVATALLSASCAASLANLPQGPGEQAVDAAEALAAATAACGKISSFSAEAAVSGSVGGRRVRGRLHIGLAAPASARLEAVAPFGQPLFIFVAHGGESSLLLTRENRVLRREAPEDVLEAIAGVPLEPAALRTALLGCLIDPVEGQTRRVGEDWRVVPDGPRLAYLHRQGRQGPWRLVAVAYNRSQQAEWQIAYDEFETGLPRRVRFVSADRRRFNLRLDLSQVDLNVQLEADAFEIRVPETAAPMTLEELRRSGPLGE